MRMTSSSEVDERTLREIYMSAFESIVKQAKPWAVMCSYNKINGKYAFENRLYITDVLRKEWGFEGCVVSDWGAVLNRVAAVAAGMDLTMPVAVETDGEIVDAVKAGKLPELLLDAVCKNILNLVFKGSESHCPGEQFDFEQDHALSRYAEEQSAILLKNIDAILPLSKYKKVAFIGEYAVKPVYQGGGSSKVNAYRPTNAFDEAKKFVNVTYSAGYNGEEIGEQLLNHAAQTAKEADVAVVFVGTLLETEGADRQNIALPTAHVALIEAMANVQPNMIVVLHSGSPLEMPWIGSAKAILEMHLGGEAVGEATANLLFGKSNPCGRLPETFPKRLEDNPSYLFYFGTGDKVEYREGVYVGYRYYEGKKIDVLFPFGHGLSYTSFRYSNLKLSTDKIRAGETLTVFVDITNTGTMAGKETVQLYMAVKECTVLRPVKELRGFEKIELAPGETKTVAFTLGQRDFSYWNSDTHCFYMPAGKYEIQIGKSASDVILAAVIETEEEPLAIKQEFTMMSLLGEALKLPAGRVFMAKYEGDLCEGMMQSGVIQNITGKTLTKEELLPMLSGLNTQPLTVVKGFLPGLNEYEWKNLLNELND
jgi:beta-glucosidase